MFSTYIAIAYDVDSASFDIKQFKFNGSLEDFCGVYTEDYVENKALTSEIWKKVESGRNKAVFYDPETQEGVTISAKNHKM